MIFLFPSSKTQNNENCADTQFLVIWVHTKLKELFFEKYLWYKKRRMKNELLGCIFLAVAKKLGVAANTCCSVVKSDRPSTRNEIWNSIFAISGFCIDNC